MSEEPHLGSGDSCCRHRTTITFRTWSATAHREQPFRCELPMKARRIETVLRRIARFSEGGMPGEPDLRSDVLRKAFRQCRDRRIENGSAESSDLWGELTHRGMDLRWNHAIRRLAALILVRVRARFG